MFQDWRAASGSEEVETTQTFLSGKTVYSVFFVVLAVVVLIATLWPYLARKVKNYRNPGEEFASARGTQPWWSISCSFFSTSLGCWVLTAPVEIAQEYSLFGIVGYAIATSVPWMFVAFFGPKMRRLTDGKGFSNVDFVKRRLGCACHVIYSLISFMLVFLGYVVECLSLMGVVSAVCPEAKPFVLTTCIALAVCLYTSVSGIQATLLTDRFQLGAITTLTIISSVGIFRYALSEVNRRDPHFHPESPGISTGGTFKNSMVWTKEGFVSLLVLNISCFYPTFMDPASWSRMYAAKTEWDASVGLLVAAALLIVPMLIFGFMGLVSGAALDLGLVADGSLFSALTLLPEDGSKSIGMWFMAILLTLAVTLSTSTIDTLSTSMTTFVVANFSAFKYDVNLNFARTITLALTLIGILLVIKNPPSVLKLFMCCNLITTCCTSGLLLSLWSIVSSTGVLAGIFAGALTVNTIGWVYYGKWTGGWDWWLFPEGSANLLALYTFVAAGVISVAVTLGVSLLHFKLVPGAYEEQVAKLEALKDVPLESGKLSGVSNREKTFSRKGSSIVEEP